MQQRILERRPGKFIILADYEEEEIAEILEGVAIAVWALSVLSTSENKILVKYLYQHKTHIPRHNFVLSEQHYTNELLDSQSEIRIIVWCRYYDKAVLSSLYGKLYLNISKQDKIKKNY